MDLSSVGVYLKPVCISGVGSKLVGTLIVGWLVPVRGSQLARREERGERIGVEAERRSGEERRRAGGERRREE